MQPPPGLREELRRLLVEELIFGEPTPDFGDSDDLFEVGLDSMAIIRTTAFLEQRLGRGLSDGSLQTEHFQSIDALMQFVVRLDETTAPG